MPALCLTHNMTSCSTNNQLIEIRDSLSNIESVLEKFKTENPKIELSKKEYGAFYQIQKLHC